MDGIGRTCLECQAPLAPGTRFCTKCGRPVPSAAADETAPGSPAQPGPGSAAGPGFTVVNPSATAPSSAGWAMPDVPGKGGPAGADWADRTVAQDLPLAFQPPGPPSAHDRPSYGPAAQEPQGFESFRPYQPTAPVGMPGGGQPPLGPPPEPSQWPPRQPPRRHDRHRSGPPARWIVPLVILLAGSAAAVLLLAHPFSHPSVRKNASAGTRPPTPTAAGTAPASPASSASTPAAGTAPAVTEQQAASRVATMLSQSVSDRAAITSAYDNVLACDPAMTSAPKVFNDAASSRQRLTASLTALPGRATLPPALLSDLTKAWQASAAADQAFARWAADELRHCTPNDTGSPAYQATITPDDNATRYKTAFVALWNPIAARYNLTQYQKDQL